MRFSYHGVQVIVPAGHTQRDCSVNKPREYKQLPFSTLLADPSRDAWVHFGPFARTHLGDVHPDNPVLLQGWCLFITHTAW